MVALLAALAFMTPQAWAASGCAARKPCTPPKHCNCAKTRHATHERHDDDDWDLHRPSTPAERAETRRLNREFLARAEPLPPPAASAPPRALQGPPQSAPSYAPPPPSAPPPPVAYNAPPAPPPLRDESRHEPYRSQLEEYRELREAYDRQLRAYYRAFPPRDTDKQAQQPPRDYRAPRNDRPYTYAPRQAPSYNYSSAPGYRPPYSQSYRYGPPYSYAQPYPQPYGYAQQPLYVPPSDAQRWEDAGRMDPWHGYNGHDGGGNGY